MSVVAVEQNLLPHHLAALREGSGLPDDIIEERGYRSVSRAADIKRLGFTERQARVPALLIPLSSVMGERAGYSLRPDEPRVNEDGKIVKYEQPRGSGAVLDVPKRCQPLLCDPSVTLWVTEGAKKADALAAQGACAISLSGVFNWRGSNSKGGKTTLEDWDEVALNGRLVRIVFDSDVSAKIQVRDAMVRLKGALERRGAVVQLVYLPAAVGGGKQGVDDFFAAGGSLDDLDAFSTTELRTLAVDEPGGRPRIVVSNRFLPEIVDDCWKVLVAANERRPFAFKRNGRIVRVSNGAIVEWREDDLPFFTSRHADFVRVVKGEGGFEYAADRMPADVIADMLVAWEKPLPVLERLVFTPSVARDGTIDTTPGYQPATNVYYVDRGLPVPAVPTEPTERDLERARDLLLGEWLHDFPFDSSASRAHAIAMVVTVLARDLIDGPTPLFAITAPSQGTGKGLFAQTAGLLLTGEAPGVMTYTADGDELRKRITALMLAGTAIVLFDNVKRRLDAAEMSAILTSEEWSDRRLGVSEAVKLPNKALWLATGNNLQFDGEVARRTVLVRLDAKRDRPFEREGFKHDPLIAWVKQNRAELVWAGLVLVRKWLAQGRPAYVGKRLGSFESWSQVVGGVLGAAGITGFLEDRETLYREFDAESEEWRDFTAAWWDRHGDQPVLVKELALLLSEQDLLQTVASSAKDERGLKVRLGKALAARRDRVFGDKTIVPAGKEGHSKGARYRLQVAEDEVPASRSSANPPHGDPPTSGSNAEDAEDAEDVSDPTRASDDNDSLPERGTRASSAPGDEGDDRPPHPPHPPQVDSGEGGGAAEDHAEGASSLADPPRGRCARCGLAMSVVAVSEICVWCQREERQRASA